MHNCNKYSDFNLTFNRNYKPHEAMEGPRNARVLVIGLNPVQVSGFEDQRTADDLINYFRNQDDVHLYFKRFQKVSERLYAQFGCDSGAAHTDLVKCLSPNWPPRSLARGAPSQIIANCRDYLKAQLNNRELKIIICNGSEVSTEIKRLLPPPPGTSKQATTYLHKRELGSIQIVLSGFIGRVDNYSKRRLGVEVEGLLDAMHD